MLLLVLMAACTDGYAPTFSAPASPASSMGGRPILMRGTGTLLRGTLPSVTVSGSVSLQGTVKAPGPVSVSGGRLAVKDQALSISISIP